MQISESRKFFAAIVAEEMTVFSKVRVFCGVALTCGRFVYDFAAHRAVLHRCIQAAVIHVCASFAIAQVRSPVRLIFESTFETLFEILVAALLEPLRPFAFRPFRFARRNAVLRLKGFGTRT